jgi:thymidylate kinase
MTWDNTRLPSISDTALLEPERSFSAVASGTSRSAMASDVLVAGRDAEADAGTAPAPAREPIRRLLASLDRRGVRYCHWKSNIRLTESLAGGGDIDLLVDRQDAGRFQNALLESGFKLAVSASGLGHPGVFHAFALDTLLPELVHLHAYFQIVTGDSLVKAYHLPFEGALLANTRRLHGVPVPTAESELVLFALRIALKHTSLIELLLVSRHYDAVRQELSWLRSAADVRQAEALWAAWLPGAPVGLFQQLMAAIAQPGAVARRIRLGRQVARQLRGWRRLDPLSAALSRMQRLVLLTLRRRRRLIPSAAGVVIAFVGPKATGKSTLSAAVAGRLGRYFHICRVHVGKPPATAASLLPRLVLPLARRLIPGQRSGKYESPERRREKRYSLLHVLWLTVLAYDRRALLRRCWRRAAAGTIVIADRYPSASTGAIDSSRFDDETLAQCPSRLKRWLMRRERALYTGLPQPGLVIRLAAPLETTIRRDAERNKENGPDPAAVERRRKIETEMEFPGSRVITVNTDQPLADTLKDVMRAVWAAI